MVSPTSSTALRFLIYRFFSLVISFTATLMIYHMRIPCIQTTMLPGTVADSEVAYKNRDDVLVSMWSVSLGCHGIQLLGLMGGVSLKSITTHLYSCVCSLLGAFLILSALADAWDYKFLVWCFILFSYCPAAVELLHIGRFIVFDYNLMKQIEIRV